uniref:Putative glycerate kinase n=1 Tax=uncultured organism TaxID=155900 RepID=A0A068FP10_9ZZZZ|nr:putative glycerate kinase [uncultured organism]
MPSLSPDIAWLHALFDCAVRTADPMHIVPAHLPARPTGRVFVIGAGKASARMAEALESAWGPCDGLVITRYGYGRPCEGIEIVEAAHPVPDQAGFEATARMLEAVRALGKNDTVIALISGGASALMIAPAGTITLEEKQAINAGLLSSGAPIDRMNTVRKHLSLVKGGQLAAAVHPAKLLSLMISDVPGDDPAFIGSGPTVPDNSTSTDALAILKQYDIAMPASVEAVLAGKSGVVAASDPRLSTTENRVIAAPLQSLEAAAELARAKGVDVRILGDRLEGEARDVAQAMAAQALTIAKSLNKGDSPALLLSGGELTVTRRGAGIGGPNAEFMLAMALTLDEAPGIFALACDTDGVDGATDVAGAWIDPQTLERARHSGINPETFLAANDSHSFFEKIGCQVITGPTLTNVNDFRAVLILPAD